MEYINFNTEAVVLHLENRDLFYIPHFGTLTERLGRKALESSGSDQYSDQANDSPAAFTMLIVDAAGLFCVFLVYEGTLQVNRLRKIDISAY